MTMLLSAIGFLFIYQGKMRYINLYIHTYIATLYMYIYVHKTRKQVDVLPYKIPVRRGNTGTFEKF